MKTRFENEKIKILDDGEFYYFEHIDCGIYCSFTHDESIFKRLRRQIQEAWPSYDRQRHMITFKRRGVLKYTSLATFLYAHYHNITLKDARKMVVSEIKRSVGGTKDYTKENLIPATMGSSTGENTKRRLSINKKHITYQLKVDGRCDYATFHPVLYDILCLNELQPSRVAKKGQKRLYFHISGERFGFYFSQLAYACYQGKVTSKVTYVEEMKAFIGELEKRPKDGKREIDHVNGNVTNHCKYNLALVTLAENRKKLDITDYFSEPYFCRPVILENGKYRVELGYCTEWMTGQRYYVECNTHRDLTECIRAFYNLDRAPGLCHVHGLARRETTPKGVYKWHGSVKRNVPFEEACKAYERLSSFSGEDLIIWKMGSCWTVRK